jgi:hypothetical protein
LSYPWAVLPTDWIHHRELGWMSWRSHGSDATAALAIYLSLLIKANRDGLRDQSDREQIGSPDIVASARGSGDVPGTEPGQPKALKMIITTAPYEVIQDYTLLSRAKIAAGLRVLGERFLITPRGTNRQRTYCVDGFRDNYRWAKLPQLPWYRRKGGLEPLRHFSYRGKTELNALKLYLLLAAFRANKTNLTSISYTKITEYTNIDKAEISRAISLLIAYELVNVLHQETAVDGVTRPFNAYKLSGFGMGPVRHAEVMSN